MSVRMKMGHVVEEGQSRGNTAATQQRRAGLPRGEELRLWGHTDLLSTLASTPYYLYHFGKLTQLL